VNADGDLHVELFAAVAAAGRRRLWVPLHDIATEFGPSNTATLDAVQRGVKAGGLRTRRSRGRREVALRRKAIELLRAHDRVYDSYPIVPEHANRNGDIGGSRWPYQSPWAFDFGGVGMTSTPVRMRRALELSWDAPSRSRFQAGIERDSEMLRESAVRDIATWTEGVFSRAHDGTDRAPVRRAGERILSCRVSAVAGVLVASLEIATELPADAARAARRIRPPLPLGWVRDREDERLARLRRSLTGSVTLSEPVNLDVVEKAAAEFAPVVAATAAVIDLVARINVMALPLLSLMSQPRAADSGGHEVVPASGHCE
jgi:hypothetical protein